LSWISSGWPLRSSVLPAGTFTQPSLMQYSSTSKRSLSFKRMPMACSNTAAMWCGLRGSVDKRSGSAGRWGVSFMAACVLGGLRTTQKRQPLGWRLLSIRRSDGVDSAHS
jgi:hypothetical protein